MDLERDGHPADLVTSSGSGWRADRPHEASSTVTKTPEGRLTGCRDLYVEATVDEPSEITEAICYVGAQW